MIGQGTRDHLNVSTICKLALVALNNTDGKRPSDIHFLSNERIKA